MKQYLIKVFFEHFAFGLTLSVSVIWMLSQGMSLGQVALIESIALAIGLVIDIPTGWLSDKLGRKFMLVGANIFHAIGFTLFAFSHDFWQFLLAAIIQAIGFAFLTGTEEAYIYESEPKRYRKALSNVNVIDELSTILGLVSAPVLIWAFHAQSVFIAAAIVIFLTSLFSFLALKNPSKHIYSEATKQEKERLRMSLLLKKHAPLILLFIILAIYYEAGRVFWQPQLVESGFSIEHLGFIFAALKVASLAGAYVGRHQKWAPKKEIIVIGALLAFSLLCIASSVQYIVLVGFFLYFFLENVYRIIESTFLQSLASAKNRGTFLSAASFTRQGYSIAIIPLLGLVGEVSLSYVFLTLVGLQVLATVCFWVYVLLHRRV